MNSITICGAGAFGTALGISLARDGRDVTLWGRDPAAVAEIHAAQENTRRLPGHVFPKGLGVTDTLDKLGDVVLLAVPMQSLSGFVTENQALLRHKTLVSCCKGIDLSSGLGPSATINRVMPDAKVAVLSGPGFAVDIAAGLPTALTLANADAALQGLLSTETLRLYRSTDAIGVELGGALKNVIAIACGVTIGAGLGESARAALLTRGYAEMLRFAVARGAHRDTLAGLSGLGDLVLTATSDKSRNYAFGQTVGQGAPDLAGKTVEGVPTAEAVSNIAETDGLDMPITDAISAVLGRKLSIGDAIETLLSRPLREE